jgi:hypothetical protein
MSKAEELSQSRYHPTMAEKYAFIDGYEQAEKDLELGWEDVSKIRQIMFDYNRQVRNEMTIPNDEEYCQEVLKRFKAQKGE